MNLRINVLFVGLVVISYVWFGGSGLCLVVYIRIIGYYSVRKMGMEVRIG